MAALALTASAAPADDARPDDIALLRECLGAGDIVHCVGLVAEPCMDAPDGQTTYGMAACADREWSAWDAILNADWKAHRAQARAADREDAGSPVSLDKTLLESQRAWIAFRDAQCALEYARWGSGTMRIISGAFCRLEMTADRVMSLRLLMRPGG